MQQGIELTPVAVAPTDTSETPPGMTPIVAPVADDINADTTSTDTTLSSTHSQTVMQQSAIRVFNEQLQVLLASQEKLSEHTAQLKTIDDKLREYNKLIGKAEARQPVRLFQHIKAKLNSSQDKTTFEEFSKELVRIYTTSESANECLRTITAHFQSLGETLASLAKTKAAMDTEHSKQTAALAAQTAKLEADRKALAEAREEFAAQKGQFDIERHTLTDELQTLKETVTTLESSTQALENQLAQAKQNLVTTEGPIVPNSATPVVQAQDRNVNLAPATNVASNDQEIEKVRNLITELQRALTDYQQKHTSFYRSFKAFIYKLLSFTDHLRSENYHFADKSKHVTDKKQNTANLLSKLGNFAANPPANIQDLRASLSPINPIDEKNKIGRIMATQFGKS